MKYILMLFLTCGLFAQDKLDEQAVIKNCHIDFNNQYIFFSISGVVEYDGHEFVNDTSSNPFIYSATLDEVKIFRKDNPNELYEHRKCETAGCKIIHFTKKALYNRGNLYLPNYLPNYKITPL